MSGVLIILIPLALVLGAIALLAFFWTMKSGQYDDLEGAAERILLDDNPGTDRNDPDSEKPGDIAWPR